VFTGNALPFLVATAALSLLFPTHGLIGFTPVAGLVWPAPLALLARGLTPLLAVLNLIRLLVAIVVCHGPSPVASCAPSVPGRAAANQ
jgi:hypothetical protein